MPELGALDRSLDVVPRTFVRSYAAFAGLLVGIASANCQIQTLVNVDFGGLQGAEVGYAAIGMSAEDYWNAVPGPTETIQNLKLANGDLSGVSLSLSNATFRRANGAFDPMYATFVGTSGGPPYPSATFKNMPLGTYDIYIYGHGTATNQNGVYSLTANGINYGTNATSKGSDWNSRRWQDGLQFVVFHEVQINSAAQILQVQVLPGGASNAVISGLQIIGYSNSAPVAVIDPADQSVQLGATAFFRIAAIGVQPLQYQWFFEGEPISGATNDILTITNVLPDSNGLYWVTTSNAFGGIVSSKATLSVRTLTQNSLLNVDFAAVAGAKLGPAAIGFNNRDYWNNFLQSHPGRNVLTDLLSADGNTTSVGLTVTPDGPGQWSNGVSDPMYRSYMYAPNLTVTMTNVPAGVYDVYAYGHYWDTLDPSGTNPIVAYNLSVNGVDYGTNSEVSNDGWESPFWQEGVHYVLFRNIPFTNSSSELSLLALPTSPIAPLGNSSFLAGMQLIRYTNSAPVIVSPPQNYSVTAGSAVGFSQAVVGSPPLQYRWFLNGNLISNATTASLTISNVQLSDSGDYSFTVSNHHGSASSVAGHVLVNDLPRNFLLNIDFGAFPGAKWGGAAIGLGQEDYWNAYSFPWAATAAIPNLVLSDGTVSATGLIVSGAPGALGSSAADPMYSSYIYNSVGEISVTITNLWPGSYDLYIYGHGPATSFPNLSAANGVYTVSAGSVNYGTNANVSGAGWDSAMWQEGIQFVIFRSVQITDTSQPLTIIVHPGDANYALISGLQLLRIRPRSPTNINLTVSRDSLGDVSLSWPRTTPSMTLQAADDILHAQWNDVDPALVSQTPSNTLARIPLSYLSTKRFYRLFAP